MKHYLSTSLLAILILTLSGCAGSRTQAASRPNIDTARPTPSVATQHTAQGKIMIVHGTLTMRGSSRMTHLELVTDHGSYRIINPDAFGLMQQQNRSVRLKVRLVKKAIGPGFPAEVEVISVH